MLPQCFDLIRDPESAGDHGCSNYYLSMDTLTMTIFSPGFSPVESLTLHRPVAMVPVILNHILTVTVVATVPFNSLFRFY